MTGEYLKLKGIELTKGKIPIDIYKDKETTFKEMARLMADTIKEKNSKNEKTLFIVPLGPVGQYKYFVEMVNNERISLKNVTFINMDEYMVDENTLLSEDNPQSFKNTMYRLCYNLIDKDLLMNEDQRIFPNQHNADLIDEIIEKHNGVDICFGGIGITGHMAFNEPPEPGENISEEEFISSRTRVAKVSRETKVVNSMDDYNGAYYLMPSYCVTIGLKEILNSKKIRLYCFRDWHKSVVRRAAFGERSINFPASLLQTHSDARIGISEEVAK